MSFFEVVRFSLRGLSANKLRSALTMLGILIGVAAVILLVAVGNGSAKAISDRIEALGTNTITVMSTGRGGSSSTSLTKNMADALIDPEMAPDVKSVSPVVSSSSATMTYEGTDHSVATFVGTTPSWFAASTTPVGDGAAFTDDDVAQGRRVVVIGQTVAEELFPGVDPIDKQVTVGGALFTIVGVLSEKSSTGFNDANDTAVAPLTAVQQVLTGYGALTSIIVEAADPDQVDAAQSQVSTILNQKLDVDSSSGSTPYRIQNASSLLETQTETADTFTTLLG
ncbi:ABC transporter permease, partial [Actinoplanes derwentensis]